MDYQDFLKRDYKETEKKRNEEDEIITAIVRTRIDLDTAIKNYEFAEFELIDYYLYQMKANKSKLDYLIKKAKEKNIELNMMDKLKYEVI